MSDYCRTADRRSRFYRDIRRTVLTSQVKRAPISVDCTEAPT